MSGLWSYFVTKMTGGGDMHVRKEGKTKVVALAQRVSQKTESMEAEMEECFREMGVVVPWYQISGDKFKPLAWGDEAVVVDEDYLKELPREVAKVMVAERVLQVSSGKLQRERRKVVANLTLGTISGALVVLYRRGQPHTLRRAFTISIVTTIGTAFALRVPSPNHVHLTTALRTYNNPVTTSAVLAFEEQKLAKIEENYHANAVTDPKTGLLQHRIVDVVERDDARTRVDAIRGI
eukprot:TRINITY_DN7618_c0_g1_i1.p2 TRINITY_DN7618_c0_g1~~TRINITY_DN7618_c0_g1_i1.p2  ORF type:complete len:252 (+),score=59.90 TRINITY_DN7618_c0_g1_i1:50-757(+)